MLCSSNHIIATTVDQLQNTNWIVWEMKSFYSDFEGWWQKCIREKRRCWVYCDGDYICGIVIIKPELDNTSLKICTLLVRNDKRDKGIGKLLLEQALIYARDYGFHTAYIALDPSQDRTIVVVSNLGFSFMSNTNTGELLYSIKLQKDIDNDQSN